MQLNALGAARRPLLWVADYAARHHLVLPLDAVDATELAYDFRGRSNVFSQTDAFPLPDTLLWEAVPPLEDTYLRAFNRVMMGLQRGDSFLCNLTCRLPLRTNLTLDHIYHHAQAPYRLHWRGHFACFSPEPFMRIAASGQISTFPMKGTMPVTEHDAEARLLADLKEQAEHATVVDLLRNDLSQVARDVVVHRYRYVEQVESRSGNLLQTSSEIVGQLPKDWYAHLGHILLPLLPAGSITGAPKPATCHIIAEAEGVERGFYTGVMGLYDGETFDSAVMIRFVEQQEDGSLVFRAGGGITAQSDCAREYREVLDKVYVPF